MNSLLFPPYGVKYMLKYTRPVLGLMLIIIYIIKYIHKLYLYTLYNSYPNYLIIISRFSDYDPIQMSISCCIIEFN